MKPKLAARIAYAALGLVAVSIGIYLYWTFQPTDVLEIRNEPVPVRTLRVDPTADAVLILHVDYCKRLNVEGRLRISFVSSSNEVFLPVAKEDQGPICQEVDFPILIPQDLSGGKYKVHFRTTYQINPLKEVIEEFDSSEFDVADTVKN